MKRLSLADRKPGRDAEVEELYDAV
jgi:hypothetical protein